MARKTKPLVRLNLDALESVVAPATFTVLNTLDGSVTKASQLPGSLRQAVFDANALAGNDSIIFDPSVFAAAKSIVLTSGQFVISDGVTIIGPAAKLTINGNKASRIFRVDAPGKVGQPVALANLELTNGNSTVVGGGGAIQIVDEAVSLSNVAISSCVATGGGAILLNNADASLSLSDCILTGNSANNTPGYYGGAIFASNGTVSALRSTIANNTAHQIGGIAGNSVTVTDSTISGNVGGGISGSLVMLRNCTVANNFGYGVQGPSLLLQNCTVAFNSFNKSTISGGGVVSGSATLESTIVANNEPDVFGTIKASYSLIGNTAGSTITGSDNLLNVDAKLDALASNGGPTQTCLLLPGSPAIDAGSNPAGLAFDQRGPGFPRVDGPAANIGAAEGVRAIPTAAATAANVSAAGGTAHTVTVTYADAVALNVSTIGTGDITVKGPFGFSATPAFQSVDINTDGTPRVATYTFTPPGGSWDADDNGDYTVTINVSQVANTGGDFVPAGVIGGFNAFIPTALHTVKTLADSGPGSLRQAILDSNATPFADTVTFAPGVAGTISLASDLIVLGTTNIQGPGAGVLALTRTKGGHILRTSTSYTATGNVALTISGLTLRDANAVGGSAVSGSAILSGGSLTLRDCVVTGNGEAFNAAPYQKGGAINHSGSLTLEWCTFSSNVVRGSGGAVYVTGSAVIRSCTFSGNSLSSLGSGAGGAVAAEGNLTVEDSTFVGNSTTALYGRGGAVGSLSGALTMRNCTVSGNGANSGGGLYVGGAALLQNCTVTGNGALVSTQFAGSGGGLAVAPGATVELRSTIVSNNSDDDAPDISGGTVQASHSAVGSLTGITSWVNQGNNLPPGTDLMLGPLASNGGPTQTVALLSGSPAVNAGSNPAALVFDQRGAGFDRVRGKAADIGAYELQSVPPVVAKVVVNDGSPQRSRVTSVTVEFDRAVSFTGAPVDAFALKRHSDGAAVALAAAVSGKAVTLTFTGGPVEFGSLADGRYTLTSFAALISPTLDGNGDGIAGDDYVLASSGAAGVFRLFGDADGDGDSDTMDFGAFRGAFGAPNLTFDFDGDGDVDAVDFGAFRQRFGATV